MLDADPLDGASPASSTTGPSCRSCSTCWPRPRSAPARRCCGAGCARAGPAGRPLDLLLARDFGALRGRARRRSPSAASCCAAAAATSSGSGRFSPGHDAGEVVPADRAVAVDGGARDLEDHALRRAAAASTLAQVVSSVVAFGGSSSSIFVHTKSKSLLAEQAAEDAEDHAERLVDAASSAPRALPTALRPAAVGNNLGHETMTATGGDMDDEHADDLLRRALIDAGRRRCGRAAGRRPAALRAR